MEQEKRGRGRPKIDAHITEVGAPSRRQAINAMYMYEGVHLLSVAATDIPDSHLLYQSDDATMTVKSKNGILEQLGRGRARPFFRGRLRLYRQSCHCRFEERQNFQRG